MVNKTALALLDNGIQNQRNSTQTTTMLFIPVPAECRNSSREDEFIAKPPPQTSAGDGNYVSNFFFTLNLFLKP
jgi:hypothetical protein